MPAWEPRQAQRRYAEVTQRHRTKGHRHPLSRCEEHVEFTGMVVVAHVAGQSNEPVGGVAHGRNDYNDTLARLIRGQLLDRRRYGCGPRPPPMFRRISGRLEPSPGECNGGSVGASLPSGARMSSRLVTRIAALTAAGALATAACGSSSNPQTQPTPAATTAPVVSRAPTAVTTGAPTRAPAAATSPAYQAFRETPTACQAEPPPPVTPMTFVDHEDQGLAPDAKVLVVFETSCGDIEVELNPAAAPLAVNSFVFLARRGYFDGSVSHRIIRGFMFQTGDPSATGTGGSGYRIAIDEWPSPGFQYERGVVAMANAGPASTGS